MDAKIEAMAREAGAQWDHPRPHRGGGKVNEYRTQFDYLLNALERASQAGRPAEHGYGQKRAALYAYVRELEAGSATTRMEAIVSAWSALPADLREHPAMAPLWKACFDRL